MPAPTGATITRWQDDEFARGSYAYSAVGTPPEAHDLLATPVGGVLHLAGEATWTDDPATVTDVPIHSGVRMSASDSPAIFVDSTTTAKMKPMKLPALPITMSVNDTQTANKNG